MEDLLGVIDILCIRHFVHDQKTSLAQFRLASLWLRQQDVATVMLTTVMLCTLLYFNLCHSSIYFSDFLENLNILVSRYQYFLLKYFLFQSVIF